MQIEFIKICVYFQQVINRGKQELEQW